MLLDLTTTVQIFVSSPPSLVLTDLSASSLTMLTLFLCGMTRRQCRQNLASESLLWTQAQIKKCFICHCESWNSSQKNPSRCYSSSQASDMKELAKDFNVISYYFFEYPSNNLLRNYIQHIYLISKISQSCLLSRPVDSNCYFFSIMAHNHMVISH